MIKNCKLINLEKISDPRGSLTFIENNKHIPFEIKRAYYIYDLIKGSVRGGHAHKALSQFIVAVNGSFDILLDDGINKKKIHLSQPNEGLYVPPMIWREMENFSNNCVCFVLASDFYIESDYYRNYDEFLKDVTSL